jgi:hypothetical protein
LCAIVQILADKGHATIPTALNLFEQIWKQWVTSNNTAFWIKGAE